MRLVGTNGFIYLALVSKRPRKEVGIAQNVRRVWPKLVLLLVGGNEGESRCALLCTMYGYGACIEKALYIHVVLREKHSQILGTCSTLPRQRSLTGQLGHGRAQHTAQQQAMTGLDPIRRAGSSELS